jgi:hypothetical protein
MRKPLVIQLALLLIAAAILVLGSSFKAEAGKKCISIGEKRICFEDGKNKKSKDDDGDDGGGNEEPQKTGNKCQGEIACPPGYVVLDKPNEYGACCEPKEGFCPPDRPSGTPPNCCPEGTTFREGHCYPTNCGPGMVGTPPHCDRVCAPGKIKVEQTCYDPCPPGTIGTPPSCKCPDGQVWDDGLKACKERPKCPNGMVGTPPNCKCPPGTAPGLNGTCRKCDGGRVVIDGQCACPKGTIAWPRTTSDCVKGNREACTWRGTAPFCDGSCEAGEEYRGASSSPSGADWSGGGRIPGGFGKSCASGSKYYCCRPAL